MENFAQWLESKFLEWENKTGKRKTIGEFANYLGVDRSLVSYWMNGKRKPSPETADILADVFGTEVYDLLDMPHPDPDLRMVNKNWSNLPKEFRRHLREEISEYISGSKKHGTKSVKDTN